MSINSYPFAEACKLSRTSFLRAFSVAMPLLHPKAGFGWFVCVFLICITLCWLEGWWTNRLQKQFEKGLSGKCGVFLLLKTVQSGFICTTLEVIMKALGNKKTIWNVWGFLLKLFFCILCLFYQLSLSKISCYIAFRHSKRDIFTENYYSK